MRDIKNIKKIFSTGTDNYKEIIEEGYCFIDKTMLIREFVTSPNKVLLIPRPRRFGKSLNISMLKYFLDNKESSKDIFKEYRIWEEKDIVEKYLNKYPVISISFKDVNTNEWERAVEKIRSTISKEYRRHAEVKDILDEYELKIYEEIEKKQSSISDLEDSLKNLSQFLYKKYNKRVVILIDEYDKPMHELYKNKEELEKCINFFRSFYVAGLKGNDYLEKGTLTGILKVAKEGMMSGLNNVNTYTILSEEYSEYFGFKEEEVKEMMEGVEGVKFEEAKEWYNGYNFGKNVMYNPWSVLNYLQTKEAKSYWVSTASDELILEVLREHKVEIDKDLGELVEGRGIEARIPEGISIRGIKENASNFWSLMLYAGYLTIQEKIDTDRYKLKIPNREILEFYNGLIIKITGLDVDSKNMMKYLLEDRKEIFEDSLKKTMIRNASYHDANENFYHGMLFMMGLMLKDRYRVRSNVEAGLGRPDIEIEGKDGEIGVIIEIKVARGEEEVKEKAKEALKQIKDKRYSENLEGKVKKIVLVGIAFKGKEVELAFN